MPGSDVVHIGARNLRRVSFDFVHSIGGCFGFRLLHQVDRASSYFRSISRCTQRIALLRARLVRGSTDRAVVLPQSSVDQRPQLPHAGAERVRGLDPAVECYRRGSCSEEMVEVATRVLIAGGGVAALEAALALRALAEDRVSVEMLAPEPEFWYRPLAVAEPFDLGEVRRFELPELAAAAGATFSPGALTGVDAGSRQAQTSAGSSIPYDVLLVACGAGPSEAVPGALTFRGPADTEKIRRLFEEIVAGQVGRVAFVVPWGAVWSLPIYELALMTAAYLAERELGHVDLALVTPEEAPLQLFGRAGSEAVRQLLEERGIALHTGSCPVELVDGEL